MVLLGSMTFLLVAHSPTMYSPDSLRLGSGFRRLTSERNICFSGAPSLDLCDKMKAHEPAKIQYLRIA